MVIKGDSPACIIKSEGGLGKSYLVRKMLNQQCNPDRYEIRSGHITPLALYKLLYEHRHDIVVLDDAEGVLNSNISVGILKAALWDVDGNGKREITWASTSEKIGDTPQKFSFNGGIILLCNKIPRKHDAVVAALRTRCLEYEIKLTYKQKLNIFKQLIDDEDFFEITGFKPTKEDREKLKRDLEESTSAVLENFNFRTVVKLMRFYSYGKQYHPDKPDLHLRLHRETNNIDEEKEIVYNLMVSDIPVSMKFKSSMNILENPERHSIG